MTLTATLTRIMADGRPYSISDLMEKTGKQRKHVAHALQGLLKQSCVKSDPVRYSLTAAGLEKSVREPKTDPRRLALKAAREARNRAARQDADGIVAQAKAKPHALHGIWGGAVNA